jgi:hypothetical protein
MKRQAPNPELDLNGPHEPIFPHELRAEHEGNWDWRQLPFVFRPQFVWSVLNEDEATQESGLLSPSAFRLPRFP